MNVPSKPPQTQHLPDTTKGLIAGLLVVACWSGFNIVSRFGTKGLFTPFDLAAMRYGVSGLLGGLYFVRNAPVADWPRYLVLSLFGGLGYGLLVYSGFSFAPSAHAGIFVNGGIPFCTALLVAFTTGFRLPRHTLIALTLSAGGLLLIGIDSLLSHHGRGELTGDALFLAAALSWSIFGLLMRRWQIRPLLGVCGIAFFALLLYSPVYLLYLPKNLPGAGWGDIALQCVYQGFIAALLAAGLYSYANQKIGACQAAMMLSLVPAVSAIGAYFILDEQLTWTVMAGIVVVSVGAVIGSMPGRGGGR